MSRRSAAPAPAQKPDDSAQAALWLPPPVKPPQISSRVAASPAAYRPGTLVAHWSLVMRKPPVPRTVPSSRSATGKCWVKGSMPRRSKVRKKFGCAWRIHCLICASALSRQANTGWVCSVLAMMPRPRDEPAPSMGVPEAS